MRINSLFTALVVLWAGSVFAEQPLLTPEQLREDASHIVVGKIQKVYESKSKEGNWAHTDSVAEISIQTVEKGKGIAKGQLLYARIWNRSWIGERDAVPPSASGHYAVQANVGRTVRAFVVRNKNDQGFDVLLTNGMQEIKKNGKSGS